MDKRVTFLKFKDINVFYFIFYILRIQKMILLQKKKKKFEVEFIIRTN